MEPNTVTKTIPTEYNTSISDAKLGPKESDVNLKKDIVMKIRDIIQTRRENIGKILNDFTPEDLIYKWTEYLVYKVYYLLYKYYISKDDGNVDAGNKLLIKSIFGEVNKEITYTTFVLNDFINDEVKGLEDIFISVYGVGSDEVYALRKYQFLFGTMHIWDERKMWDNCGDDLRMLKIIAPKLYAKSRRTL